MNLILDSWKNQLENSIKQITNENIKFSVSFNDHLKFGHASTNAPLVLGKYLKTSPEEAGVLIIEKLKNISDYQCTFSHPGFINVTFTPHQIVFYLNQQYQKTDSKKILVEYTDPNPFKPFHIGHLMANATGQFISNAYEFRGNEVTRICYSGDVGRHIAMSVYGMRIDNATRPQGASSLREKIKWLGGCYRSGYLAFDNESEKQSILELNKQIYSNSLTKEDEDNYQWGKSVSYMALDDMYETLGTKFDSFILESEAAPIGLSLVKDNMEYFSLSEGAIVFAGEGYGLHTRVFVNSLGLPTYEAKDLGNMKIKIDRHSPFDESVVVTANEQSEYFKVVNHVISKIFEKESFVTKHYSHGIMRFKNGKMSSRNGTVVEASDLIDETVSFLEKTFSDKKIAQDVLEKIAIGAVKFAILKQSIGSDIVYDFEKVISIEGDSAPYLMYTYSRISKLAGVLKYEPDINDIDVLLYLSRLRQSIIVGVNKLEPQLIIQGLLNLAHNINSYYTNNRIKDNANREALITMCKNEIEDGMKILGMPLVNEM